LAAYNYAKRLKTLNGLTPFEFIVKSWSESPHLLLIRTSSIWDCTINQESTVPTTRQSNLKEIQIMLNYLLGDGNGDIKQASRRNASNRKKLEA